MPLPLYSFKRGTLAPYSPSHILSSRPEPLADPVELALQLQRLLIGVEEVLDGAVPGALHAMQVAQDVGRVADADVLERHVESGHPGIETEVGV